jgi:signal transduction histidine kinase
MNDHLLILTLEEKNTHLSFHLINGKWIRAPNPMDSMQSDNLIYNEPDQSWWTSKFREIARYDQYFHLTNTYTTLEGIPDDGNINNINSDANGNIWFATHKLVSQLNPGTGKITTLSEKDGVTPQPYYPGWPIVKLENSDLYVLGGYDGLDRIKPKQLVISYPGSSVYLKSLKINQQPFPIPNGLNSTEKLSLTYTQNSIDIETGIIDYYSKGSGHIRYKLEGTKGGWQYGPANYTIRYEELPPGKYKLVMQASNAVNDYNGPEKILYFSISPPWWKTWWAYLVYILISLSLVWSFIQYRSRNLRRKNILLEERVMSRTKELKHSLEDLRETQTQLIQREKMASLGELTAGIAHEIQNPLNFVNNFSELNTELIAELDQEIDTGNLREVKLIAKDIKENEQKINHHGKRADAIVKGMLQHSRNSTGLKELTDINALTDEYLRLSYHGLRAKDKSFNSSIHTDYDPSLSYDGNDMPAGQTSIRKIKVIPEDIGRVLLNLFNNAFYSVHEKKIEKGQELLPDGKIYEPSVWVTTKKIGDKVEIRVKDNGIGIPQKVLDKIYQPFFTTKPTGQGTGLGLYLSYDIITKAHGGQLKVDSKEDEYAEFIIQLPG